MKIQFYRHKDIDKTKWDEALNKSSNKLIYACSWYLDCVTRQKWDALISEDFQWIMPLTIKQKWGISYLPTPYFIQQLGIFGPDEVNEEIIKSFMDALPKNINLIEYQFNHFNAKLLNVRIAAAVKKNLILTIDDNFLENKNKVYNTNTSRNIKKAESFGLSVDNCVPLSVINLFKNDRGKEFDQLKANWYDMFAKLCEKVSENALMKCLGAFNKEGKLIAGIVVFIAFGRHILIASGNSDEGKTKAAMHFLIDNYLSKMQLGDTFDFEGTDHQNLALFYKGFGSIEANYLHLKINNLPSWLKWIKK